MFPFLLYHGLTPNFTIQKERGSASEQMPSLLAGVNDDFNAICYRSHFVLFREAQRQQRRRASIKFPVPPTRRFV